MEVHKRCHRLRVQTPEMGDPVPYLAYELICETQVLLLDEVAVTDVADALMMRKVRGDARWPRRLPLVNEGHNELCRSRRRSCALAIPLLTC